MGTSRLLVIAASGQIGTELVRQLSNRGHAVRALVRDRSRTRLLPAIVEVVVGDLARPATLAPAFAGVERAFVLMPTAVPSTPSLPELEANAYSAAIAAGTRHIVKISGVPVMESADFASTPVARWHLESEAALRGSGLDWTLLRPAFFSSNVTRSMSVLSRGGLFLPAGTGRDAPIDPRDVAAVASHVLTSPGHEGMTYDLTGPELLTYDAMVQTIARIAGVTLRYVDVPESTWRKDMLAAGAPPATVASLIGYYAAVRNGAVRLTATVETLLGQTPRTFEAWARDELAQQLPDAIRAEAP